MALDDAAGTSSHDTIVGKSIVARHVAFAAKCQVILPEEGLESYDDDDGEDYFTNKGRRGSLSKSGDKLRRRLSLLKSRATSHPHRTHSTGSSSHASDGVGSPLGESSVHAQKARAYMPAALSPSLPVNRLRPERKKLVSPPPPERELSPSPADAHASPMTLVSSIQGIAQSFSALPSPSDTSLPSSPVNPLPKGILARPTAVRKPIALGNGDPPPVPDKPYLRVPQVVEIRSTLSPASSPGEKPAAHAILSWTDDEEGSASALDAESDTSSPAISSPPQVFSEEDLNEDCVCQDCEDKMRDALSPGYTVHWTRDARRKYLADRQEALNKERRKTLPPPIWLRATDADSDKLAIRSLQTDEVDVKKGKTKSAPMPRTASPTLLATEGSDDNVKRKDDEKLDREVAEEVRIREEEARAKKERTEMRRLSCDVGTGLRVGGGGARAMMRQLEQAEQAERRARIERVRSPKIDAEEGAPRPMGAAGIDPSRPLAPTKHLNSPFAEHRDLVEEDRPSRTPSPFKRMLSAVRHEVSGTNGDKSPTSSQASSDRQAATDKASKTTKSGTDAAMPEKDVTNLHKSTSPLIKRELTLGIPVQTGSSARTQSQWHQSSGSVGSARSAPPTPPKASKPLASADASVAPPKASKDGSDPQSGTSSTDSGGTSKSSTRLERAQSMNAPRHSSPLSHGVKTASQKPASDDKSVTMRRAFSQSQGPRPPGLTPSASSSGTVRGPGTTPRSQSLGVGQASLLALDGGTVTPARHKARSSIRDLVARMRN